MDDVTCPMCLEVFTDPCFVCPNHHTLCRKCYSGLVSRTHGKKAQCPQCREQLTRPVENSQMRGLIKAYHQEAKWPPNLACQAPPNETEGVQVCPRRVFNYCDHCDRYLCDLHFSSDRLKFQEECQKLLSTGETVAAEAKAKEALLASWGSLIDDCIEQLQQRRKRLIDEEQLPDAASSASLQKSVSDLQDALNAGNIRGAKAASVKLEKTIELETKERPKVSPPPSIEEKSAMTGWLSSLVDAMELRYCRAASPGPAAMMKSRMFCWIQACAAAASSWVTAAFKVFESD